jgi:tetratricopeptide (TPR) repeat protein
MNRVSSIRVFFVVLWALFLARAAGAQGTAPAKTKTAAREAPAAHDPQKVFAAGEAALRAGRLDEGERAFRQVLAINPGVAGAYANLGVIHMRRKQWPQALAALRKAEKLAPDIAGIRLNIGLAYFHQNDFARAIRPFESVVAQSACRLSSLRAAPQIRRTSRTSTNTFHFWVTSIDRFQASLTVQRCGFT